MMLIAVLAFAGCKPNKGSVDSNGMPQTLVIAAVGSESNDQIRKTREQVRQYLEKKVGIPVEMVFTTDYDGVIEALKSKKVQMAYIPPFAYVIATRTDSLTPIVVMGENGKPSTYHSVLIVKGNSPLNSMADVKAHAKSLTFCFVEPASTSGHLIPRAYLTSIGLNPDTAFKHTIFAGTHPASVLAVKSGKVDLGCTTDMTAGMMEKAGMLKDGDVKVLWTSDPIVGDPIVVRNDVNKAFAKKIQQAYLDMNTEAPEILKAYLRMYSKNDTSKRSYMVAQDSFYNGLRRIASTMKGLKAN